MLLDLRSTRAAVSAIGLVLIATSASAQQRTPGPPNAPTLPAAGSPYYGESWALLIGVDRYRDSRIPSLRYAVNDVEEMRRTLEAFGFRVITLLNEQATLASIEAAFRRLATLGDKDRLVVFFAGHGESVRLPKGSEEGFLVPHDADRSRLVQTAIPMRDIDRLGERLPPKHILFVLDACHSGFGFVGFRDIEPEVKGDAYYLAATQKPVVQVLTAGETGQKATEREGHGVFTRWLAQGLRGAADRDGDGVITANELAAWVEPHVTRESRGLQKPVFGRLFGEGQFLFELPGRAQVAVAPLPTEPTVRVVPRVGAILIRSPVEVDVSLGDRRLGEAGPGIDLRVENVRPGTYTLAAAAKGEGYEPWRREIQIEADRTHEVPIELRAARPAASFRRGWLGVSVQPLTPELARAFGLTEMAKGVMVGDTVPDAPAAKSGLRPGDILLEFDGKKMDGPSDLQRAVALSQPNQNVKLKIWRDQSERTLDVTIGEVPETSARPDREPPSAPRDREQSPVGTAAVSRPALGLEARPVTPEIVRQLNLKSAEGVVVTRVDEGSPAGEAGIQRGDVIREVNRQRVRSMGDFERLTKNVKEGDRLTVLLQRGPMSLYVAFTVGRG